MPHTWFPTSGVSRRLFNAAIAALLAFTTVVIIPGVNSAALGDEHVPADNCGVNVVFVLDASGSMGDNSNEGITAVRAGFKSFVSTLGAEAPASNVGVVQFGTNASLAVAYTNVLDASLTTYIDSTYTAYSSPAYWTNWEAALGEAVSGFTAADAVIFITDGNPTTYNGGVTEDNVDHWNLSTAEAQANATALKAKTLGTVFGIGAGQGFTNPLSPDDDPIQPIGRLRSVVEDGRVTTFDDLTSALPAIVAEICEPSISIEKSVSPTELPEPGGNFEFTVKLTNTSISNAAVRLTEFTDTIDGEDPVSIAAIDGVSCKYSDGSAFDPTPGWIAADDYIECTWTRSFTGDPGSEHDTATATGVDPGQRVTKQVTDEATITITPVPGIRIEKSTNGGDADVKPGPSITVGDPVTWTYVVTNTGSVDLTGVIVTDDILGDICTIGDLDIDETQECEAVSQATLGQYANIGTAVDNNGDGSTVTASDPSHYLGVPELVPAITVEKSTNGEDADTVPGPSITVGDPVTWTYVVTNTGDVALTGVIVTDDILGDVCTIGNLAVGDSETCEKSSTAVAGQYANIGTATDNGGEESTVIATDPSHYFGQEVLASATIGDTVWSDENENGIQDNGEKGIAGATVRLTLPDSSTMDVNTNANGLYLFSGLDAGTYKVELLLSSIPKPSEGDLKLTTAGSFTVELTDDQNYLDADFGVVATLPVTGIESNQIAIVGLALLLAGAAALAVTWKREDEKGEGDIAA